MYRYGGRSYLACMSPGIYSILLGRKTLKRAELGRGPDHIRRLDYQTAILYRLGMAFQRIAIFGDCHGCPEELKQLVGALSWLSLDAIFSTGDLVDRGPDSGAVVDFCRLNGIKKVLRFCLNFYRIYCKACEHFK